MLGKSDLIRGTLKRHWAVPKEFEVERDLTAGRLSITGFENRGARE